MNFYCIVACLSRLWTCLKISFSRAETYLKAHLNHLSSSRCVQTIKTYLSRALSSRYILALKKLLDRGPRDPDPAVYYYRRR